MKKILLTGATGYIGRFLCEALADRKHRVYALYNPTTSKPDLPFIEWIPADLAESFDQGVLPKKIDTVVHLAQSRYFKQFPDRASDIFNVNTLCTAELLDYGKKTGIRQFIYASTGGIDFGKNTLLSNTSDQPPFSPLNFYYTSKYMSELLIRNYTQFFSTVVLRLFFVYGPGQKETMFIPKLIANIENGNPIFLYGDDGILINPIFIDDVINSLLRLMELEKNMTINIAGSERFSLRQLCEIIGGELGKKPVFTRIEGSEQQDLSGDISQLCKEAECPKTSFTEGMKKVIDYNRSLS